MVQQIKSEVLDNRRVGAYHVLSLTAPGMAERSAGHFVTIAMGGEESSMVLRRAFAIHQVVRGASRRDPGHCDLRRRHRNRVARAQAAPRCSQRSGSPRSTLLPSQAGGLLCSGRWRLRQRTDVHIGSILRERGCRVDGHWCFDRRQIVRCAGVEAVGVCVDHHHR